MRRRSVKRGRGQYPREKGSRAEWHKDAITMFKAGRSQSEIAEKHGVSRERVNQVLVQFGGHQPRERPEVMLEKVMSLYEADKCVDEIAKKLGKDFFYITKVLKRAGVSVDPVRRYARHRKAVALASEGKTIMEISEELGVSSGLIFYVLRRFMKPDKFSALLKKGEKLRIEHSAEALRRDSANA